MRHQRILIFSSRSHGNIGHSRMQAPIGQEGPAFRAGRNLRAQPPMEEGSSRIISSEKFMPGSVLSRLPSSEHSSLSPLQTQVDRMVEGFIDQATEGRSLAAMVAGGMAYR